MLRGRRSDHREAAAVLLTGWLSVAGEREPSPREADTPERFKLLASAIAGRSVDVAPIGSGESPWTDGVTVFIDLGAGQRHRLAALAVQSSLLAAGSLEPEVLAALERRRVLAGRYLSIEGHRALSSQEHLLPPSVLGLMDRDVAARTSSPAESLAIATTREEISLPPDVFGVIRPKDVRARAGPQREVGVVSRHVPSAKAERELIEFDSGENDDGPAVDMLSSQVGGGGGLGRLLKKLFGEGRSPDAGPPGADSSSHWSRGAGRKAHTVTLSTAIAPTPDDTCVVEQRRSTYPEWDLHQKRYKPDWCTVAEVEPGPATLAPFQPPESDALLRPLARLGMDLERHHRQPQGDDIDIDASVEARVDVIAGSAPGEALYIDTLRRRRDLSVLVLLDVSASSAEPSATGVPVYEHQRAAAAALTVALHDLGDRVALYAFRSQGRYAVYVLPVKRFSDDLNVMVMQRLGGFVPGAYTRLGAAIRHSTALLERDAGTSRRLLAVISDGLAYDHGYERAYGEADARRALAEARHRGIGSLCLSIGACTDAETLRGVFGTAAHATIPRVEQLPAAIGPLLRSALRAAEMNRRVFQRRERTRDRLDLERRTA